MLCCVCGILKTIRKRTIAKKFNEIKGLKNGYFLEIILNYFVLYCVWYTIKTIFLVLVFLLGDRCRKFWVIFGWNCRHRYILFWCNVNNILLTHDVELITRKDSFRFGFWVSRSWQKFFLKTRILAAGMKKDGKHCICQAALVFVFLC